MRVCERETDSERARERAREKTRVIGLSKEWETEVLESDAKATAPWAQVADYR